MTLEFVLRAAKNSMIAGHHAPHCYSAHVPGQGYVNDGSIADRRADFLKQLDRSVQSEIDNMGYATGYAEPGYHDPARGVLLANWNVFPRNFDRVLENLGYAIEWSDEWTTCDDCGKAFRTSPDSYSWQCAGVLDENGSRCLECIDPVAHLESLEDDPSRANTIESIDPADHGYVKYDGIFESGFHPGQNDDPSKILAAMQKAGLTRIVFSIDRVQQFDTRFSAWYMPEESEDE